MENKISFQLNVTPRDAIGVILTRLRTAVQDAEQAHQSLEYAVDWFSENRDSIVEFLEQVKDVRSLLFEADQNLDEHSQILARLMVIRASQFLPQEPDPNEGILDKALENLAKEEKEPEKDK